MESTVVIDGVRYELDRAQEACVNCAADQNDVCDRMPACEGHSWKLHESQPADEWQGYTKVVFVGDKADVVEDFPTEAEEEHFNRLDSALNELTKYTADGSQYDVVEKPKHYMLFEDKGIEVRDVCAKLVDKVREGSSVPFWKESNLFESDYVQMMQYLMRFMDKNGVEDLKKARWYLDKMIGAYGKI